MAHTYWHKQSTDQPLFPDLLWSRPENKRHAGKLLIIGGNSFGFSAVGEAYGVAQATGAGAVRVLLPVAIRKVVGNVLEHADFAASNPSGGFSKQALAELLHQADWADGVLWAGDVGHNSETTIVIEQFLSKQGGQVTLCGDALDLALHTPDVVCQRPNTLAVASMAQLQKLAIATHSETAFRHSMDLLQLVEGLHSFTTRHSLAIMVKHHNQVVLAVSGQVSTTLLDKDALALEVKTAARASVWWLQNPDKPFEAFTSSIVN